jgi:hypothetical protein
MPHTIAKRYKLPEKAITTILKCAPKFGSQGRAIQIGIELLAMNKRKIKLDDGFKSCDIVGMTYKLTPRTIEQIEELAPTYGRRGDVLAACAQLLSNMAC